MAPADLPATILLLLPGYVAVRLFFWRSHWRAQSDVKLVLWSLGSAFLLLAPVSALWHELWDGPAFTQILRQPSDFPAWMPVALFAAAPVLGSVAGWVEDSGALQAAAARVGIDLRRREDVWWVIFSEPRWCIAHLTDGTVIFGWPTAFSRDRREEATELYLTEIAVRGSDDAWDDISDVHGMWVEAEKIQRLYVTPLDVERSTALSESWVPDKGAEPEA